MASNWLGLATTLNGTGRKKHLWYGMVIDLRSQRSPTAPRVYSIGSVNCFIFVFWRILLKWECILSDPKVEGQLLHICICICIFEKSEGGWPIASYLYLYFWEVPLHSIGSECGRPVVASFFPDNHHRRLRCNLAHQTITVRYLICPLDCVSNIL